MQSYKTIGEKNFGQLKKFANVFYRQSFLLYGTGNEWKGELRDYRG